MSGEGARPPKPAPLTCGQCGEVADDWEWDERDQEWENDFEWWHHPPSGHDFLCRRWCWIKVHRASCGNGECLKTPESSGQPAVGLSLVAADLSDLGRVVEV